MMRFLKLLVVLPAFIAPTACDRGPKPVAPKETSSAVVVPERPRDGIPAYEFKLPTEWEGRNRIEQADGAAADSLVPRAKRVIEYVYLPLDRALGEQSLLMLIVMAQADWVAVAAEPGPPLGEVLAEQNGYAYVAALPQSNPYAGDSEDARRFDQMHLDLNAVKAAFKLLAP